MRYNKPLPNEGKNMSLKKRARAVSNLLLIILMVTSAIVGGIVSYMFTIALFIELPEETALAITGVYFDAENATAFTVSVLNPSYSPTEANITKISLSLKGETQLYDVIKTAPSIQNGTIVQKGEVKNITCLNILKGKANVTWGRFAGEMAGKTVIVHVFAEGYSAANMEAKIPFVKLKVVDLQFNSLVSFKKFNVTISSDAQSAVNLTIRQILVSGVSDLVLVSPTLPCVVTHEPIQFVFNGSWHGVLKAILTIYTEEGWIFTKDVELSRVQAAIRDIVFDEDYTDRFNVTIVNFAESANHINVAKFFITLDNETKITIESPEYLKVEIQPNTTRTFTVNWNWAEYRGREIAISAYFLQDFETSIVLVTTPQPVIIKLLNKEETFKLQDKTHFNITLQNHLSSLYAVNITKITVKETGELINETKANPAFPYGLIEPNSAVSFYCNISDWSDDYAGGNLTLTVHVVANETLDNYTFNFTFTLPAAEFKITNITCVESGGTNYLNITVENMNYSVWNLTIAKIIIVLPNQTELEQVFPINQITVEKGGVAVILCLFDYNKYDGEVIVTVVSDEGIETPPYTYTLP